MDELLKDAIEMTIENGASTSLLQRTFSLGFNKADKIMGEMERLGVVGKFSGTKPRKVLIKSIDDIKCD
jgi:S-DNA-T family DNA segregation ATPase FtsK/SpoIIIE